jgi:hypothetical protein
VAEGGGKVQQLPVIIRGRLANRSVWVGQVNVGRGQEKDTELVVAGNGGCFRGRIAVEIAE